MDQLDYLTFVPDGEPTLDANLALEIDRLRPLGIPIAVITNNSLLSRQDVRDDLSGADWVSLKIDAVTESVWRRVNRPHRRLQLASILEGARAFAESFPRRLVTETMLVAGVNDEAEHIQAVAAALARLRPETAYLAVPTRPPTEVSVRAPDEETLNRAYQILSERVGEVEYPIGYEGNAFAFTGNVEEDLLNITAVHPMREDAVSAFLARAGAKWEAVHRLVEQGRLIEAEHGGHAFYLRRLRKPRTDSAQVR